MSKNCKHEWMPLGNDRWSCKNCAAVKVGYVEELKEQLAEANINIGNLIKAKSLSDEIISNALQTVEKLDKEKQLIKSVIQSGYNGGQTYCTLPNGKECYGDMGYVTDFFRDVCKNYPELENIFGEQGDER